jgi:hypothetical protein
MKENPDLQSSPNIHYQKFFDKFSEISILPVEQWKVVHLIAYFCQLYQNHYNLKYTFKFNNSAPTKSYEVFQINKLANNLSKDPIIIKDYIDWFFKEKIIARKKRMTSMGFLTDTKTVNDYKFKTLPNQIINRSTNIPNKYLDIIKKYIEVKSYGDLSFAFQCDDYKNMFDELVSNGFDLEILKKVK